MKNEQHALKKLQIKTKPISGLKNYKYLQKTWKKNVLLVFKGFLNCKTTQIKFKSSKNAKIIEFYHNRGTNLLILDCTIPILANMGLHKSTNYTFQFFLQKWQRFVQKKREDTTEGTFFVLIRNAIVDIIFKKSPKHLQISFSKRPKPILNKLNVSKSADTTVYEMRLRGRSKNIGNLRLRLCFCVLSVTKMKNWEFFKTRKQRSFEWLNIDGCCG